MNKPINIQSFVCEVSKCPDIQRFETENKKFEAENKKLKQKLNEVLNDSEILHENNCLRLVNAKLNEDLSQTETSLREWKREKEQYKQALEEIRDIAIYECRHDCSEIYELCTIESCLEKRIQRLINEVLEDGNNR